MPTPSEHKALAFLAAVTLLAGAVRVVRAGGFASPEPSPVEQQGLARQAFAANSASVHQREAKQAKKTTKSTTPRRVSPKKRDAGVNVVGGVSSVPFSDVRPGSPSSSDWSDGRQLDSRGFPPPDPRIDVRWTMGDTAPAGPAVGARKRRPPTAPGPSGPVDLDSASEEEIETLPRVGPALARRIVASRDSLGPFRSLDGLRRVKGIGPATISLLGPLVTFSRQKRP